VPRGGSSGSHVDYLLFLVPTDSLTVVLGFFLTVNCFTNLPVTALRPRFPLPFAAMVACSSLLTWLSVSGAW
jgi:hypothetical protein